MHYKRWRRNGDPNKLGLERHKENPKSPEYNTWCNIKQRCYLVACDQYPNYGARGIEVCDRWLNSFSNFLSDMGRRPGVGYSIERVDVNRDYEPSNCLWATMKEQQNNRRNNIRIDMNGKTMTLAQWCDELGVSYQTVWARINVLKWTPEKALIEPKKLQKERVLLSASL